MRTSPMAGAQVATIDAAIEEVRRRLGLRSRWQVAIVCTFGALASTVSLVLVMPLAIVAGVLWILWETARWIAGGRGAQSAGRVDVDR